MRVVLRVFEFFQGLGDVQVWWGCFVGEDVSEPEVKVRDFDYIVLALHLNCLCGDVVLQSVRVRARAGLNKVGGVFS